jgi:hypothetical protein
MEFVSYQICVKSRVKHPIDQKFYVGLKSILWDSEMQPGVMRAQKHDIQISRVTMATYR